MRPAVQVLEGRVVRRDQPRPCAAFDAHVADGHPLFHREAADRFAAVLEDAARAAAHADLCDQGQDDVLARHALAQPAVDAHLVVLRLVLQQALRRQHVADLAGADAERQRAERAVRRRVAVAADDRHARLGQPLLRADDVDDSLPARLAACRAGCRTPGSSPPSAAAAVPPGHPGWAARRSCVGMLWSSVPNVLSGRRTFSPRSRSIVNAWGDVTSCTRCRSIYSTAGLPASCETTCPSQILSSKVLAISFPSNERGDSPPRHKDTKLR